LTIKDAKTGIAMLRSQFSYEVIDNQEYIFVPNTCNDEKEIQRTFLMPDYDEYGMSYKDRSTILISDSTLWVNQDGKAASNHMIVIDGVIKGTWQQTIKNKSIDIETNLFTYLSKRESLALEKAIEIYKAFFE
jgi:hypothetical protein